MTQESTLAHRVCEFFQRNPTELLDEDAIAVKFNVKRFAITTELIAAVNAGLLARDFGFDHGYTYIRGPALELDRSKRVFKPTHQLKFRVPKGDASDAAKG